MTGTAPKTAPDFLRKPLTNGDPVTYWRLAKTHEARFDITDQPMQGEMDPFFFLTKHKNFIPHEYPCRTEFAKQHRARRPDAKGSFSPTRNWLPFGSPRVDLSGFWFRPTFVATWAQTHLSAAISGRARVRLTTCGGAILFLNGREVGWMAPYSRNLEAHQEFMLDLEEGDNELTVYFDDLAERDARYFFELDFLDGPKTEQALSIPTTSTLACALEAALDGMRFEKSNYGSGEVALVTDAPLPVDAKVSIRVEGDFMSTEHLTLNSSMAAGSTRLTIANTEDLPADFRHFAVTLDIDGFAVSRIFGVEICHTERQGLAPVTLEARIKEALGEVAAHGEDDTVRALARLAEGKAGQNTDQMIAQSLAAIEDCHDCADFILVPLIWCRQQYADDIAPELRDRIDSAILGYRYWMDEPGNDVQWYFSENHALLFHTAAYLGGHLLPQGRFVRSGRLGLEQSMVGAARVRAWLDHFETAEMAEFNSAPYFPIDLKGLTILMALAPDADIRARAEKGIVRLLEIVARSAHHGMLTGAQGRSYEHTLRAGRSLELSGIARLLWGTGNYGRRVHAVPQLALCLRDHGLKIPPELAKTANFVGDTAQEWCFAQGEDRIAKLYHYKTRDYAMGSAAHYRWNEWGYQETILHLRIGQSPDAQIWINHPGETIHSGYGRPSYWGGSGTLPRIHQYRDLAVLVFDCAFEQPDFTHAWFPQDQFDFTALEGDTAMAQSGDGLAALKGSGPLKMVQKGPTAGNELRLNGHQSTWIVRLGSTRNHLSPKVFFESVQTLIVVHGPDGILTINDPDYGEVLFYPDGRIEAEGRTLDPEDWSITGHLKFLPIGPIAAV